LAEVTWPWVQTQQDILWLKYFWKLDHHPSL